MVFGGRTQGASLIAREPRRTTEGECVATMRATPARQGRLAPGPPVSASTDAQETFAVNRINCSRIAASSLFGRFCGSSLLAWNAFAIAALLLETPRLLSMFWTWAS